MTETLANRRIFRSKVDTIRTDVRLRGRLARARHGHGRPRRRRPQPVRSAASTLGIPVLAAAMDAVADVRLVRRAGAPRRALDPQPRGRPDALRRPDRGPRAHRVRARRRHGQDVLAEAYAPPIREELIARRIDELHAAGSKAAVSATPGRRAPLRPVLRRARRGPVPRPVAGLVGPPPRDRLRAAGARGLHPVHADPGRGRQHDQRRGRLPADGAGRRGDLRRRRAGRRVHDARGAGHRDPAGHRDRRRRRGARPYLAETGTLRARWSPTAA